MPDSSAHGLIVHLNGWPGAGKKTVGELLARRLGARFLHNHLLHDVSIVVAGMGDPDRWPLYRKVRDAAYEVLANKPAADSFVMTNALCTHAPNELETWARVVQLAIERGAPLIPVVLDVALAENQRRVASVDRIGKKMSDPAHLADIVTQDTLQRPAVPELFELDTTNLTPEQATERIEAHVTACRPRLQPATRGHLQLVDP